MDYRKILTGIALMGIMSGLGVASAQVLPDCTKDFYILDGKCTAYPVPDEFGKTYLQRSHCPLSQYSVGNDCLQAPQACTRRHGNHSEYTHDGACWCEDGYEFVGTSCEYVNTAYNGGGDRLGRIARKLGIVPKTLPATLSEQTSGEQTSSEQSSSAQTSSEMSTGSALVFTDVPDTHPYREAILWGKNEDILDGYPDGTFQPEGMVNRAEFLKMILQAKGTGATVVPDAYPFSDVDPAAWYGPAVSFALQNGIVQGYPDGTFRPEQLVSLAEVLKMSYLTLGIPGDDAVGMWYHPYLNHAIRNNVLHDNELGIDWAMTRQDVIWIIWKLKNL